MTQMGTQTDTMVHSDGEYSGGSSTSTRRVVDPETGQAMTARTTRMWGGRSPIVEFIWLVVGIIALFLAGDFIFRAAGANDVGFAHFVMAVGGFFATPFVGIFNTSTTPNGHSLWVWADVLAAVVYAIIGWILVRLSLMAENSSQRAHTPTL